MGKKQISEIYLPDKDNPEFIYDYDIITVQQAEYAREVAEFKMDQAETKPDSFNMLLRSGSGDWLSKIISFLVVPVKNNKPEKFDLRKAIEIEERIKTLPANKIKALKEIVEDFFTKSGNVTTGQFLLREKSKLLETKERLTKLMTAFNMPTNNTLSGMKNFNDAMKKESLKED